MQLTQLHQTLNSRKKLFKHLLEVRTFKSELKKYVIVQKIEFMLIRYTLVV